MLDSHFFLNKKVLITGSSGFKGSWLSIWLNLLGAKLYGISLDPPTKPSLFNEAKLNKLVKNVIFDISDSKKVFSFINELKPDYIFHLAAQPLVRNSYLEPIETWKTNVLGTVNILDSLRFLNKKCICIIITSDKCYENQEWEWGYRESDKLGGGDPYSASKASAELAFSSYFRSYFSDFSSSKIRIASARAGNVIGGGDWAESRIVPDCIRAWSKEIPVKIKSPNSTRPFQHVLEPLSGYLSLAKSLTSNENLSGQSFNFGPPSNSNHKVIDIVNELSQRWKKSEVEINKDENSYKETKLLKLNCDKALSLISWEPRLNFKRTIQLTGEWYFEFYKESKFNALKKCEEQIKLFNLRNINII